MRALASKPVFDQFSPPSNLDFFFDLSVDFILKIHPVIRLDFIFFFKQGTL